MSVLSGKYSCCVSEHDSQVHTWLCVETGGEFIWSPAEAGTYEAAQAEHLAAHRDVHQALDRAKSSLHYHYSWCRLVDCPQHRYLIERYDAAKAATVGVSY